MLRDRIAQHPATQKRITSVTITAKMTNPQHKKCVELCYFKRAQELLLNDSLSCWSIGKIDAKHEAPDIVVEGPNGCYGVEVITITESAVIASQENRKAICDKARQCFKNININGLDVRSLAVAVTFKNTPLKNDLDAVAAELVKIVCSNINSTNWGRSYFNLELSSLEIPNTNKKYFGSDIFADIYINYISHSKCSLWQPISVSNTPQVCSEDIQTVINKKEIKISKYRERAQNIWLLIVVNGFGKLTASSVHNSVLSYQFCTTFNGIVLLDYIENKAHVLRTVCKTTPT
ncbi:MAG: hypothetical protein LBH31_06555 [Burkholderiaceae bacterium]|nr:hypothetical protein [Burkholderiaceae bacterium]